MWLMKMPQNGTSTGTLSGIPITEGMCLVNRYGDYYWLKRQGFEDLTGQLPGIQDKYTFPKNLLIIRHGQIGDCLGLTPMLRKIKKLHPETKITFYSTNAASCILQGNPYIDEFAYDRWLITQAGRHYQEFDDAWDFTHSIEFNGDANFESQYIYPPSLFGMDIAPEDAVPELFLGEKEKATALAILNPLHQQGLRTLIGVSLSASMPMRSIPERKRLDMVYKLAKAHPEWGFVLYGDTVPLALLNTGTCSLCGRREWGVRVGGAGVMGHTCPTCNTPMQLEAVAQPPNVLNLHMLYPLRLAAATTLYLKLLLTVNTGMPHIAAAVGLPFLMLEAPFDWRTTVGTFPNMHVMQKAYPCAPCFRLTPSCQRMDVLKRAFPPCLDQFTTEEVVAKVEEILAKPEDLFHAQPSYDTDLSTDDLRPRPCPICGEQPHVRADRLMRKGHYAYYKCPNPACSCLVLNRLPTDYSSMYNDPIYEAVYGPEEPVWNGMVAMGRQAAEEAEEAEKALGRTAGAVLDVGCFNGRVLIGFHEKGWDTHGIDFNEAALEQARGFGVAHTAHGDIEALRILCEAPEAGNVGSDATGIWLRRGSFDAVVISHTIEHLKDPVDLLVRLNQALVPDGVLWVATPEADIPLANTRVTPEWPHLNTQSAGEHTVLFTRRGLTLALDKAGFVPERWGTHQPDSMQCLARKV